MSKIIRISDDTYRHLISIQKALIDQKDETHSLIAIAEKVLTNADLTRLYGIDIVALYEEEIEFG